MPKLGWIPEVDDSVTLYNDDCRAVMLKMKPNTIDSIVTDPPYGLGFMGEDWDKGVPSGYFWRLALRVAKPGRHMVAFGGTRVFHRLAVVIEDAGWEICDCLSWLYGQGFPKSKACLKPAWEPILLCRKPGKVVNLNIDDCRIGTEKTKTFSGPGKFTTACYASGKGWDALIDGVIEREVEGRWPANVVHDGSEEVIKGLPSNRDGVAVGKNASAGSVYGNGKGLISQAKGDEKSGYGGEGSVARFFYCAKASVKDREQGTEGLETKQVWGEGGTGTDTSARESITRQNFHPTVKPTSLMRWLIKLITPTDGIVFDPFMGSGSTGKAAKLEGRQFIGVEKELDYFKIAQARIRNAS